MIIPNDITDSYWLLTHNSFAYDPDLPLPNLLIASQWVKKRLHEPQTSAAAALKIMFKR